MNVSMVVRLSLVLLCVLLPIPTATSQPALPAPEPASQPPFPNTPNTNPYNSPNSPQSDVPGARSNRLPDKSLPTESIPKLSKACLGMAASLIQADPTTAQPTTRANALKALSLAKRYDPENPQIIIMHTQLSRGALPSKTELAIPLPQVAAQMKEILQGLPDNSAQGTPTFTRYLRTFLLDLIVTADPTDESSILALAEAEKSGPANWSMIQGNTRYTGNPGFPGSGSTPGTNTSTRSASHSSNPTPQYEVPATPTNFSKNRSVVKSLFVTEAVNGNSTGIACNLIATVDRDNAYPNVSATITGAGTIGEHMNTAMNEAVRYINVQKKAAGQGGRFTFGFEEKYAPKDGGSAGTAFALLLDSFFSNYDIAQNVAITGDFSAEGKVLKVGGITQKIDGAIAAHCRMVIIPEANSTEAGDMAILASPMVLTKIQVFEASDLDAVRNLARTDPGEPVSNGLTEFDKIVLEISAPGGPGLRGTPVQEKLAALTAAMPNHVSARYLLMASQGKLPRTLSLEGSLASIFESSGPALPILLVPPGDKFPRLASSLYEDANKKLIGIQYRIDPRTKTLHLEMLKFLNQWKSMEDYSSNDQTAWRGMVNEWMATRQRIGEQTALLTKDPEYIRKAVQGTR